MESKTVKRFNTFGPCEPDKHYALPVLGKLPLVDQMFRDNYFFTIHAPRLSGKTTFLNALTDKINSEGQMYALNVPLTSLQNLTDDTIGVKGVIEQLNIAMSSSQVESIKQKAYTYNQLPGMSECSVMVKILLKRLCVDLDKDLVVFFDDVDCLSIPTIRTFLAQIRDSYNSRNHTNKFIQSLGLVSTRNLRDYRPQVPPGEFATSVIDPFNIVKEVFTLPNSFTLEEIGALFSQSSKATGQVFEDAALERVWYWSEGQPWVVNALANEVVDNFLNHDYSIDVTSHHIDQAARALIKSNHVNFEPLKERLKEPIFRRIVEAVLIGASDFPQGYFDDGLKHALALGLLKTIDNDLLVYQPVNPIYQEVIVRSLSAEIQKSIEADIPISYVNKWFFEDYLDMTSLLESFQDYWSKHSDIYIKNNLVNGKIDDSINLSIDTVNTMNKRYINEDIYIYVKNELIDLTNGALTHLVLFAFLQRAVNGRADFSQRENALRAFRADICIDYKGLYYPLEFKLKNFIKDQEKFDETLEQFYQYINKNNAKNGWLIIFDIDFTEHNDNKLTIDTHEYKDKTIHVVYC
ncbi:MAG: hypothetical protein LBI10_05630 [Deltaproteobacteria bacterium]|nr:hypothetical protein [Deltaproteobacteria bacterium]